MIQDSTHLIWGQMAAQGMVSVEAWYEATNPLEKAIADPLVDIETLISLAEDRARAQVDAGR